MIEIDHRTENFNKGWITFIHNAWGQKYLDFKCLHNWKYISWENPTKHEIHLFSHAPYAQSPKVISDNIFSAAEFWIQVKNLWHRQVFRKFQHRSILILKFWIHNVLPVFRNLWFITEKEYSRTTAPLVNVHEAWGAWTRPWGTTLPLEDSSRNATEHMAQSGIWPGVPAAQPAQ